MNVAGHPWTEIDFPYDLDVARREVWPAIWRGRWRKQVYWKRTRWLAWATVAFVLALLGWIASTRLGPASVNWETVPLAGAEVVRIERDGDSQRWWDVPSNTAVSGQVNSPEAVVEVRLVLPDTAADSLRYVVALTVDGQQDDWRALTANRDSTVHLAGAVLADRDRIELSFPPGAHQVGVSLLAGHTNRMLVRLRQAVQRED